MSSPVLPPLDGSLTLTPGFVDFHAKHNPDLPWVVFPSPNDPEKLGSVSFAELAKATHRIAHRVRPRRQGPDGEVVGLLIHCDALLYAAVIHGLARAGLVAFPISPRLSPPAIAGLLQAANAHRIITQSMLKPLLTAALSKITSPNYSPQVEDLWSIYDIFPTLKSGSTESALEEGPYPERDTPFNLDEPVAVLHSSGSTGLPKAVFQTHRIVLQWASSNFCIEGRKRGLRWAAGGLPTLHAMGFIMQVIDPLGSGQAFALFTPTEPRPPIIPTADQVLNLARTTKCSAIPTVPIFIETWAQSEESVKFLASLTTIGFAGGPLSSQTGIKLVKAGVSVQSMYGSTEGGVTSGCFDYDDSQGLDAPGKTSLDFEWMQFPPPVKTRFVDQGDGTYEMQYLTCETHQPAVENLPDTKGYATSDLFVPHPTKKGLWRVVGRVDDVIVLSTGEKIVPIPQESHISSSPLVAGAVMFGRGKTQPGVLIEPHPSHAINPANETELIEYRNKVWPVIAEANALAPTFAKIYKETILVSDPAKPFPRAPKGTVIRKAALALYTDAVENLYKAVEQSAEATGINAPASWEVQDIQAWLKEQAASLHDDVSPDVSRDLFEQGFDSLSATFLRNRIISALRLLDKDVARNVSQNLVFDHPTIEQLAEAVRALAASETTASRKPLVEHIKELVEKYSADLPQVQVANPLSEQTLPEPVVLLTGSTGNIGSHILSAFLGFKRVQKVYVLNRNTLEGTPQERLTAAFKQRGLPVDLLADTRLVILGGDLNAEWFGLEKTAYEELKSSVSHIVHNAWKVDFNLGLGSFETQIAGTRKLIDFAASQSRPASLLFTSSVSVAGKWDVSTGPVPETVLDNPEVATSSGYSASKYIVEKILAKAAQKGLTTTSLRIGQVTGSAQAGAWNTSDWVPIMVKSSLSLGALPSLPGSVSWIPVDAVANIILDLVVLPQPEPPLVNVVHPRPIAWDTVFKLINDAIGANLPAVPYAEWLSKLEAHERDSSAQTLQKFPALKLLTFFRAFKSDVEGSSTEAGGHPVFSTTELLKQSGGALALPPLGPEHAQAWVRYWKDQAFLS